MFKAIALAAMGAVPGLLAAIFYPRVGVAWALVGAFVAACFAIPGVTASRVARLTVAWILIKNIGLGESLIPDSSELTDREAEFNRPIASWLHGEDLSNRRGYIVAIGLGLGVLATTCLLVCDYSFCEDPSERWTYWASGEVDLSETAVVSFATIPAVFGALAAVLFCPAYRRPILFFNSIPAVALMATLIAGYDKALNMSAFFVVFVWVGLLFGLGSGKSHE